MNISWVKGIFFGSVRRQLITGVVLIHSLLMAGFIYDMLHRQKRILLAHEIEHATALAETLAVSSADRLVTNDLAGLGDILQAQQNYSEIQFALLTNMKGTILSHTDSGKLGLIGINPPGNSGTQVFEKSLKFIDVAAPVVFVGRQVGWARVGIDPQKAYVQVKRITLDGVVYFAIAVFAGIMVAWLIAYRITHRLHTIQEAINAVKSGEHEASIRLKGTDEAAILAGEFNAMLNELSRRDERLKRSAEELRNANLNLEKTVQARTHQLSKSLAQVGKSEIKLKMAQSVAHIGSWNFNFSKDELTCSDETYAIFEMKTGMPIGVHRFFDHVHPGDRDSVRAAWNAAFEGSPYDIEYRIRIGEKVKWVHEKAHIEFDAAGAALNCIGTVQDITERKRLEQRLQDIIDLDKKIVNASPIGIIAFREDGPCILANPSMAQIKGTTLENALSLNFHNLDTWKENGLYEKVITVFETQEEQRAEIHLITSFGNDVWLKFVIAPFTFGDIRHFVMLAEDITELKTYEIELKEREELYRSIFDSHSIMLLVDPETAVIMDANQAACSFYGYSHGQLLKMRVTDINAASPESVLAEMDAVKEGRKRHLDFVHRLADGTLRNVEVYSGKVRVHGKTLLHSIVFDVTERRQAEESFRIIFERSPDAYLIMELDNARISECNSAAEAMLGGTKDQILGKTPEEISPSHQPDGRSSSESVLEKLDKTISRGSNRFEWMHRRFDSSELWVDVSIAMMTLKGRQVLFVAWRDIGERKRVERELERTMVSLARSNEELENFAYIASHDLQEPLRMVSSYVQLLAKRYKDKLDEDANDFINFAVDGALRMKGMIDALLWYARVNTRGRDLLPVDSELAVGYALKNLEMAIAEQEATIYHDALPMVTADPNQLEQLFQNLIGNAIKFRKPDVSPLVSISTRQDGRFCHFIVADNGIGIDMKDKDRIFQVFQRLHTRQQYSGTGIGLSLCKKIVQRHGGEIWVTSEEGRGLSVHFTLPAVVDT